MATWLGGIQAQEVLSSLYAVGLRLPGATEAGVESALADRSIARAWPMRSTIHFMPAEDALWTTQLLGPRQNKKSASVYRKYGLTEDLFNKARPILEKSLAEGPKIRSELTKDLAAGGVDTSDGRGMLIFKYWGQEGVLCIGPRHGKQQTLALLASWAAKNNTPGNDEEAFFILAQRYFQSHGPATLRDFVWWTGATVAECKRALEASKDQLISEVFHGQEYFFKPHKTVPALDNTKALLLPAFDEYTVAYADRRAVMQTDDIKQVSYGINPNIIIDGRAVGMWKRILKTKKTVVVLQPFTPFTTEQHRAIEKAVAEFGRFMGVPIEIKE